MILGIFTALAEVGGIQQFSRHAAAALEELARSRNEPCTLWGLNDARDAGEFEVGAAKYNFRGFARSKTRLAASCLKLAPQARLVFLGHPNLAPLGLLLRLRNPRLRYWVATHGIEVWEPLPGLRRAALQRADGVTAVSVFTGQQLEKIQHVAAGKIRVVPPALDPAFVSSTPSNPALPLPAGGRAILTVGRLLISEPGKGVDSVIQALTKLKGEFPNLYYIVVGDGDARPGLERMAEENGVRERIIFAGEQKLEALKAFYCASDVFVMPSRQEGFGIVFLEAMFMGKPIIAGDHGGTPEVVENGVSGCLVKFNDVEGLTEQLRRLLGDAQLRAKIGEAGRRVVEERYSFDQFRQRFISLCDRVS